MPNIKIAELDFDNIKRSIIDYMKSHPDKTFNSYDFDGSGLNTLIDLLAYNTHHQSYYLNMVANEMFLDTAKLRENLVSKSKLLGYIPKSNRSSTAIVDLTFKIRTNVVDDLGKDSIFWTQVNKHLDSVTDDFAVTSRFPITKTDIFTLNPGSLKHDAIHFYSPKYVQYAIREPDKYFESPHEYYIYSIKGLELIQGNYVEETFIINNEDINDRYILSNNGIDINTIIVEVRESEHAQVYTTYHVEKDNMKLNSESEVYFLQESYNEQYEIYFGDGILGKQLPTGTIISVKYIDCLGETANGRSGELGWVTSPSETPKSSTEVKVIGKTWGGHDKDSMETIRHSAPREFSTQRRAVTAEDYRTIIEQLYPSIDSINVWGGEDNDPPIYGKVLLSIKPTNALYLSDIERERIQYTLRHNHSVLGISPILLNPTYIKLNVNVLVKYNSQITMLSIHEISDMVRNNIIYYSNTTLNSFGDHFRYSKFLNLIDNTHSSIKNNITKLSVIITKEIHESELTYIFKFSNKIKKGTIKSSPIKLVGDDRSYTISDNINGELIAFTYDDNGIRYINPFVNGTINYISGEVILRNVTLQRVVDYSDISVECVLQSFDVYTKENQVLYIDVDELDIEVIEDSLYVDDMSRHTVKIL
jgi:hypothetical protein